MGKGGPLKDWAFGDVGSRESEASALVRSAFSMPGKAWARARWISSNARLSVANCCKSSAFRWSAESRALRNDIM